MRVLLGSLRRVAPAYRTFSGVLRLLVIRPPSYELVRYELPGTVFAWYP